MEENNIKILGARVHNLQNVDLEIPRGKLVVITGLSGSGKSSLAFDTIYAEGQRRYMETLSTYARQFVGTMERPDVDKITGLSPVVAIEQKTTNKNPRSTVGTVTEISDFLRLLYARASRAYSPVTGEEMVHYTDEQIVELILKEFDGRKIAVTAPIVKGRKGHYRELFESLIKKGYLYARIDGEIREFTPGMKLDRYKIHTIDLVIDRMAVGDSLRERLLTSLREAMRQGKGTMAVYDYETGKMRYYSRHLMCPTTGVAFEDPAPHTFSFNSPKGACPHCNGLGEEAVFDREKILPDPALSLRDGGVEPLGKYRNNMLFAILEMLGRRYDFTLDDPVGTISEEGMNAILYGDSEPLTINLAEFCSTGGNNLVSWEGVAEYIGRTEDEDSARGRKWREQFLVYKKCSVCGGTRLRDEALHFRIGGLNIAEVSAMSIARFSEWIADIEKYFSPKERKIAQEIVKEIRERLRFLVEVGLGYLSLARSSRSLSGGESQRIRLATQIGSKLVHVLYILDEPSIGLHQRDNERLIRSLKELRDAGNSVIVVEHDEDMMRAADYIVDVQLLFRKVVFGNRHVVFVDLARRRTLPCRQSHVLLVGIGALIDQLRRRVPMHAVMHLVLYRSEKALSGLCRRIVIDGRSVNVRNLLVKTTFRQTNLADALQLLLEIVFRKHRTAPFQPLIVHHPSLYGVVLDNRIRPLAELYGTLVIDLEAYGDNHLETIMFHFAADLTAAFGLNYPEIPDSCRLGQFVVVVDLPDMLVNGAYIHPIQLRHHSLGQPNVFILIPEFHAGGIFTRSRHEGQVFGGRTADRYLFIAHTHSVFTM